MSFQEIERVLGFALPASARTYQAWWANDPKHSQAKAWLDAGAKSGQLDIRAETVVFRKQTQAIASFETGTSYHTVEDMTSNKTGFSEEAGSAPAAASGAAVTKHPAYGSMKGMIKIMPGVDLTEPADPEWAKIAYGDDDDA